MDILIYYIHDLVRIINILKKGCQICIFNIPITITLIGVQNQQQKFINR